MEDITGINEVKIDRLVLDIYSYSDRVKQILEEVEILLEKTSTVYESNTSRAFMDFFSLNKKKFETISKNILSYSEDMINVKSNYQKRSEIVSEKLLNTIESREEN